LNASLLRRLIALEQARPVEAVDDPNAIILRDLNRQLDAMATNMRARPDWKPCGGSVAEVIAQAKAAERAHALR
jgi:hypothetical protein